jgi:hypothetical protein
LQCQLAIFKVLQSSAHLLPSQPLHRRPHDINLRLRKFVRVLPEIDELVVVTDHLLAAAERFMQFAEPM